jgi:hypothetical protein
MVLYLVENSGPTNRNYSETVSHSFCHGKCHISLPVLQSFRRGPCIVVHFLLKSNARSHYVSKVTAMRPLYKEQK